MSPRKTLNYYLMRIDRVVVWILLLFMILIIVTGYGLTKPNLIYSLTGGTINFQSASYLHRVLDLPLMIFLLIHVVIETKFSLMRWGFKNQKLLNLLLLMLASICLILIIFIDGARP
jgi:hypothetical protein